jgi:hypothetical protein
MRCLNKLLDGACDVHFEAETLEQLALELFARSTRCAAARVCAEAYRIHCARIRPSPRHVLMTCRK